MRVFVYEHLSSGAAGEDAASTALHSEGWAMLSAVLEDFSRCPGVATVTLLDPRLLPLLTEQIPGVVSRVAAPGGEEQTFCELAAASDWALVIAPEFDDILARRSRWVEESGGRLLGPSLDAIRWAADKLALLERWKTLGIPTPPSSPSFPLVCKPRFGAGSQATFLVRNEAELAIAHRQAEIEGWRSELIVQQYAPGVAASVTFLAGRDEWRSLPAAEQHLSDDGRFHYLGGRLPLPEALDQRARRLAERAARCVEGLHGWFGVDLILGGADDGRADVVLEINPRLTTSYVGLRRLARFNLAEALLAVVTGSRLPCWDWKTETIAFRADGEIVE